MKLKKWRSRGLYQKFALLMVAAGILPITLLATVVMNWQFREYSFSLQQSYTQGLQYASLTLERLFESYNDISKISYYYSYSSEGNFSLGYLNYDNLRQLLTGENYPPEVRATRIGQEMQSFMRNVISTSGNIEAAHFLYRAPDQTLVQYHQGSANSRFQSNEQFLEEMNYQNWDTESRQLLVIPTHPFDYMNKAFRGADSVFTIARNYYDLGGMVGEEKYVGTLFLDFNVQQIEEVFFQLALREKGTLYVTNLQGDCLYSTDTPLIGKNLPALGILYNAADRDNLHISQSIPRYGLQIDFTSSGPLVDTKMLGIRNLMYAIVVVAALLLSAASVRFSRQITKPLHTMMQRMGDIETGNFEGELSVQSNDEIGRLSARFNRMSTELKNYTNQVYVSKIKQTEAQLNALKSQIYPHFLYNTLEVIRMSAVRENCWVVATMVEALADQMRYLIGTVGDIAPLESEIAHLEKYIYLINCRYEQAIQFSTDTGGLDDLFMPKLMLQPLVENAFVHGLRGRQEQGRIQLSARRSEGALEITVLDNGQGMNQEQVAAIVEMLESDLPGEKTQTGWKSIGLKNVHDRLRYLYGGLFGVSLFSTPGVGTAVKICLPDDIRERSGADDSNDAG